MARFSIIVCGLLLPAALFAQEPRKLEFRQLQIQRAASPIQIDGRLDEPAWSSALTFDIPYEWQPGDNAVPPVATDFLVTYDDHYLYAAFKAHDPRPREIRAWTSTGRSSSRSSSRRSRRC